MSEQQTEVKAPIGSVEGRPGVTVVTQENFNDYVNQELGTTPKPAENDDPEAIAALEMEQLEAEKAKETVKAAEPKEGDEKDGMVYFRGKFVKKHDFNYRLHLKTKEAEAAAQAKVNAAAAEAKKAREELEAAAKERDELRAKYEPPKSNELGPKPDPSKYTDIQKYSDDLEAWALDKARIETAKATEERQAKEAQEAVAKNWSDRQKAFAAATPDYQATIDSSPVQVTDQMRDAILESEVGPQLLYHFAQHPEEAADLAKLSVRQMLVRMGKLEAKIGSAPKAETPKSETRLAEISKAPEPIAPLRTSGGTGPSLKFDERGNWTGSPEEWKAARAAGRIK